MTYRLGVLVGKPVLVCIPQLFSDDEPRACRLSGVEPGGVWLESEDLTRIAFGETEQPPAPVFVPFAQIVCLAVAAPHSPATDSKTRPSGARRKPTAALKKRS
jgi:hypothetical protein